MECEEGIGCELADYSAADVARVLVYECDLLSTQQRPRRFSPQSVK